MNREDIIRMGQEVYLCDKEGRDDNSIIIVGHLEKFAALVASAEREACAEVCKKHADVYAKLEKNPTAQSAWAACIDNRDAIRERGQALAQRTWVNLTSAEIGEIYRVGWANNMELARAIEAKLKEKNT